MANPFANWTPEMAAAHNAKHPSPALMVATPLNPPEIPKAAPITPLKVDLKLAPTTDESKLNKEEKLFLRHLRMKYPLDHISVTSISLKLGDDCRYIPDMVVAPDENGGVTFWEVKAAWKGKTSPHIEDDSLVKLKTASRAYRWARFVIVWRDRATGAWLERVVNP